MRARNIKPGFFHNEELAECSFPARLFFPGLWMLADREGKLEYRPKRIKAEVFPFDSVDVAALVLELEAHGLVKTYSVDGASYLWIIKFTDHQRPHQNEQPSTIPNYTNTNEALVTKVQSTCDQGTNDFALNPSSLSPSLLTPESTLKTPLPPDGGTSAPKPKRERKPAGSIPFADSFADFWEAYPRKVAKPNAEKAWARLVKAGQLPDMDTLLAAVANQAEANEWARENGRFCPHPATWLNGRRWEDFTGIAKPEDTSWIQYRPWAASYLTRRAKVHGHPDTPTETPERLDAGARLLASYIGPGGFTEDEAAKIIAWILAKSERAKHVPSLDRLGDPVDGWGLLITWASNGSRGADVGDDPRVWRKAANG